MSKPQTNQPLKPKKGHFTFDAFTATLISPKYADFPCQFDEKNPSHSIVQLVEYLSQEIAIFDIYTTKPAKPFNGYTRATAFIDSETGATAFTVLYGGKTQNGTICVQCTGAYSNIVWPVMTRHFEMKVTRLDSAYNYLGAYWPVQKILAKLSISSAHHVGNEEKGHTNYFGSRTSPTMVRHYEWGKCHYPNQLQYHRENRIEVEWKPQDKKQQLQAQGLTAEQVFLRSTLGRQFYEQVSRSLAQPVKLESTKRIINTDLDEKLAHIAITYKNTLQQKLLMVGGDFERFGLDIFDIIQLHEKRTGKA